MRRQRAVDEDMGNARPGRSPGWSVAKLREEFEYIWKSGRRLSSHLGRGDDEVS